MDTQLSGRRILIVEDEPMVAWLLNDMLVDFGCTVVGSANRMEEALAMIEAQPIDAAVLDLNLGGQMSYPIADLLVARGAPFVFTTGYARNRLLDAYRACPYLLKPYHRAALRDALLKLFAPTAKAA
jgi:CheY-like chemotaxis protein